MDTFLDNEPIITNSTGAVITFHHITWDSQTPPFSLYADGNINYTSFHDKTNSHKHDSPEIGLLLSGSLTHVVNNEEQEIKQSSLFFIRPNDTHYFQKSKSSTCELITFSFNLDLLLDLSEYLEDDYFMWHFTESVLPPVFKLSDRETDAVSNELLMINQLLATNLTRVRIKIILSKLFTTYFLDFKNLEHRYIIPEWFLALCTKMNTQKNLQLGLVAMKKHANCTQEHLCKVFRNYINKTPTEFINELRMKQAKILLQESSMEIYEIGQELGISSLSRFYYLFKKYYGVPPAQYKKNTSK